MRKTKIICTVGPATTSEEKLRELMQNGMNVARINFSHGDHKTHGETMGKVKKIREELELPVALLLDTKGPEIRTKLVANDNVELKQGQKFTFTTKEIEGNNEIVSVTYADFAKDLKVGNTVLVDDGLIELVVDEITNTDVICTVLNSGMLGSRKGINLPETKVNLPAMTEKDREDLLFGIEQKVDFVAASFIRSASDLKIIRDLLDNNGGSHIQIISKIENQEGLDNIDEILEITDGIMVARGDLGVEIPTERVPEAQKMLIKKCNAKGKLVATATQMLESMIVNPRPTRAEASDVANSVYDGTHVTMLSGETAKGKYPIEAVSTMAKINKRTEEVIDYSEFGMDIETEKSIKTSKSNAIGKSVSTAANALSIPCIVVLSESLKTLMMVQRFKPNANILALASNESTVRQANIVWGTTPAKVDDTSNLSIEGKLDLAIAKAKEKGLASVGDTIIVVTSCDKNKGLNIVTVK